ncbi:AAA family ATPase [Streptomyces synnematoformans]|uniref:Polynucleotide kinase PNKP phosphatase domain-containing protein n=1 Tax=Streptomyces synnematoformans TaxID=415721 RepID=A0ABN2X9M2_9ACTN
MPTIHMMTGLPASGKTTKARQLLAAAAGRMRRVNMDDLRAMLDHAGPGTATWSKAHEETVRDIQDAAVRAAVDGGFDVVVDNTHLTPRLPTRIKETVRGDAVFVVHDLTHVPPEECIRRDALRDAAVGEQVIRRLADSHKKATRGGWRLTADWLNDLPAVKPYEPDTTLRSALLVDIDGTLALKAESRGPYDFERCGEDTLNEPVRYTLRAHRAATGDRIVLLSGRGEEYRPQTEAWLAEHRVPYDELWMRAAGDRRRDDLVKAELFDAHVRDRFRVRFSLDDRDRVVSLYRRMGLACWQVNYGRF